MTVLGVPVTRDLLANVAAAMSILTVLFATPLLLGAYVVVQRSGPLTQMVWFGTVIVLLTGAVVAGGIGLLLLG